MITHHKHCSEGLALWPSQIRNTEITSRVHLCVFPEKTGVQVSELSGRESPSERAGTNRSGALTEKKLTGKKVLSISPDLWMFEHQVVLSLNSRTFINSNQFLKLLRGLFNPHNLVGQFP